jgi:hypothetical protein
VAASAKVHVRIRAAEVMAKENADQSKEEAEQKAAQIYILFHSRIPSYPAGRLSGDAIVLPRRLRESSYKVAALFVMTSPPTAVVWIPRKNAGREGKAALARAHSTTCRTFGAFRVREAS